MISQRPDIVFENDQGHTLLVVEVKNIAVWTADLTDHYLENLRNHSDSVHYLLVSQEVGFLWTQNPLTDTLSRVEFPMRPILSLYINPTDLATRLRGEQLEIPVLKWLRDIGSGEYQSIRKNPALLAMAENIHGTVLRVESFR